MQTRKTVLENGTLLCTSSASLRGECFADGAHLSYLRQFALGYSQGKSSQFYLNSYEYYKLRCNL